MKNLFTLLVIGIILQSSVSFAQKTWTGTTSTAWNTSTNWSPAGAPSAADNVTIPSAPANQPLISGTITPVCNNLTINAGASLTINGTMSNEGMLTASGNAIVNGSLSLTGISTPTLKVVNITWGSGSAMSGSITGGIIVSGNWEFATGSAVSTGLSTVTFTGSNNSTITSYSANSSFNNLVVNKTGGAILYIGTASTSTLTINGGINIGSGAVLNGQANITTILKGNLVNSGNIYMGSGTLSFEKTSGTQSIQININDFFNSVNINTGGTVTISTSYLMQLMGNMTIQAGVLDPAGSTIGLFGNWTNNVGTAGFTEGTGTVIFNGGNYHQYSSNENFYTLEVHKAIGGALRINGTTVNCSHYNWTAGAIDVLNGGTFTANNIEDDAIVGSYYCNTNCTINLYNYGGNIDLRGNLYIYGGNFNVYGGNNPSWWPYQGNASITMSGGVLNFADQGIIIRTDATYTLTDNITGGTIRTAGNLGCSRSDFTPVAGTFEMYGSTASTLSVTAGNLYNLNINMSAGAAVDIMGTTSINGTFNINSGAVAAANRIINTAGNININSGATMNLSAGSQLKITGTRILTIANGGTLSVTGTSGNNTLITRNGATGSHEFQVNGNISARYATFEYNYGVNLWSQATVDPLNAFDYCTFQNGVDRFMLVGNSQDIIIRGANFATAPVYNNIWKSNNAGSVEFRSATGAYAGAAYEQDPYNRVNWTTATPGLWTGQVSDSWLVAANWDNNTIPSSSTDVLIPENAFTMPVIPVGTAYCRDLVLEEGTSLTMSDNSYLNVYRDFDTHEGQFTMNGSSFLYFTGSVNSFWYSNTSDIFRNIRITKANVSTVAESQGTINCSGTFEIREGTYIVRQTLTVTSTGANAFEIEDGGRLEFFIPFSTVESYGGILCLDGSSITGNGVLECRGDFVYQPLYDDTWIASLNMTGSGIQYIDVSNPDFDFFALGIEKPDGVCYLKSGNLNTGSLNIISGTLSCDNGPSPTATYNVICSFSFENQAGPEGFDASSSTTTITGSQILSPNGTEFNVLEVNNAYREIRVYGNVSCAVYDWTAGGIEVKEGATFSVNDLSGGGIYGEFICRENGTINLMNSYPDDYIDLYGEIYNYGGTINISGNICKWPAASYAKVVMTSGTIDIDANFFNIINTPSSVFIDSISGGTIRTTANFHASRPDFTPEGGTIELYGDHIASVSTTNGSAFYNLTISNKGAHWTSIFTDLNIANDFTIQNSEVDLNSFTINIGGNWNNLSGPAYFNEMTGRVRFTGIKPQYCSTEEFNILEIDKPSQMLYNMPGADIYCNSYDWTSGGIWIADNGSFYAADLADNGLYGSFTLYGNAVTLHQDAGQTIDLVGTLRVSSGQFTISGGSGPGNWGNNGNATLFMSGGVLDIPDHGLSLYANYPYNFNGYIVGGTIRTQGIFTAGTPGFSPTGGEVEIYGTGNPMVSTSEGASFWNLRTNKVSPTERVLLLNTKINNNFIVEEGHAEVSVGAVVECGNQLEIQAGSWLAVNSGTLEMHNLASVNAFENSRLTFYGYSGALAHIRSKNTGDSYSLTAHSGSLFEASYTTFEHLPAQGVYIDEGATINPAYAFANCEFINGTPGGTLLTIENNQDVVIDQAIFAPNTWSGGSNVRKTLNQGSITLNYATGDFSGENFDDDPHDRIHWGPLKQLNLQVFLEGLYAGSGTMNQAYNESGPQFGAGIADEITIEFHSGLDYYETEYTAEHVKLGTNGTATISFPASLSQAYYITIRHRNSVTTTTAAPVSFASGTISYSFNHPAQVYGGNLLQMITGQYVIYGGDVNQDGSVDTADMTPVDNDAANFISGYLPTDVNGDGTIDTADMTIIDNNAAAFVGSITP